MSTTFQSLTNSLLTVLALADSFIGFFGSGCHAGRPPFTPLSLACSDLSHVEPPHILRALAFESLADSIIFMRSSSCQSTTLTKAPLQHFYQVV